MSFEDLLAEALMGRRSRREESGVPLTNFEISLSTNELLTPNGKLYFTNISCGYLCKIAYSDKLKEPIIVQKGATPITELGIRLMYFPPDLQPPMISTTLLEFQHVEEFSPEQAWEEVEKHALEWLVLYTEKSLDLVVAYTLYTWFHHFWPKKANLTVVGFYSTGKSAVGNLLKALGRYVVQTDPGAKTSEWEVALLQGTMLIDEAESLKRSHLTKLRKMHDQGLVVSKMLGVRGGWSIISLELSAPVIIIGTHIPSDPALVSRGFILKMHYGTPKEQPWPINSDEARQFRARMLKTVVKFFADYLKALESARKLAEGYDLPMRARDIFIPVCGAALWAKHPEACKSIYEYALVSQVLASQVNISYALVTELAKVIKKQGVRMGNFIVIPVKVFNELLEEFAEALGISEKTVRYVEQYFRSAAYLIRMKGEWYIAFYEKDLETVTKYSDLNVIELLYGGWNIKPVKKA